MLRPLPIAFLVVTTACTASTTGSHAEPAKTVAWDALRNPVFSLPDAATKDAFAVFHDGAWHLGYSRITEEPFRFQLGFATSTDWTTFEIGETLDDTRVGGLASPSVVRMPDGRFLMTINSHTNDVQSSESKLYYRTSNDLRTWSDAVRIHVDGADAAEDRVIDAAAAFTAHGAFLVFKLEQTTRIAYSASGSPDGPWVMLGSMTPAGLENCQMILIDGVWHLLGTQLVVHRPWLYRLDQDASDPESWRTWTEIGELELREQSWNSGDNPLAYERANAAWLVDHRDDDGFFYLLYAGSTEVVRFSGRGHAKLGLARSTDLIHWDLPPER